MADIFVSYARKDEQAVQPLVKALDQASFRMDGPSDWPAGANWTHNATSRIDAAECVVVMWSKAAADSEFAQEEIRQAIRAWSSDRLVLVTLDATPLPVGLRDIQAISVQGGYDVAAKDLIERVGAISKARKAATSISESIASLRAEAARPITEALPAQPIESRPAEEIEPEIDTHADTPDIMRMGTPTALRMVLPARSPRKVFIAIILLIAIATVSFVIIDIFSKTERLAARPSVAERTSIPLLPVMLLLAMGVFIGAAAFWGGSVVLRRQRSHRAALIDSTLLAGAADGVLRDEEIGRRAAAALEQPLQQAVATQSAAQVFVSYSHMDGLAVDQLVQQIENLGYLVWIDRQAGGSQRYAAPIVRAIRVSKLVALMCSKSAFASDHVIREIYLAGDYKKPFIAFLLDPTDFPDEVLYFLTGFPRVPVATIDPEKLRSEIARVIAV
jgi:hypothetical protein